MPPVKILFTIPNFITAGSGQALLHVVKRLNPAYFSPSIAVLKKGGDLETEIAALGIPLIEGPTSIEPRPVWNLPMRLFTAAQFFRPYGFELWHSYHYSSDYTEPLIARLSGAKAWIYTKKNMNWVNDENRAWLLRTKFANRIAAQNTTMLELFFKQQKEKVVLLPRGVDTERFRPNLAPSLGIRRKLGLSQEDFLIGKVANVFPIKGHETVISALQMVPQAHLVLAGSLANQAYVNQLKALAANLGVANRLHFLGEVDNIPALHAELDAFVLATRLLERQQGEGFGVALLEALACGTPSIATRVPGPKDILEDEVSGLLVPPEDVEAMGNALLRLYTDKTLREKLGQGGRQRVLENYRIEREVQDHENLYADILKFRIER